MVLSVPLHVDRRVGSRVVMVAGPSLSQAAGRGTRLILSGGRCLAPTSPGVVDVGA